MARILVTGGTGQVGYQVAKYLVTEKPLGLSDPSEVVCLVRNLSKAASLRDLGVQIVKGDLTDSDTICEIMNNGIEYVFHIAANVSVSATYEELYSPNVLGTRILLDAFAKNATGKVFVHTSSIGVYDSFLGKERIITVDETSKIGPLEGNPYAVTKRLAENLVRHYSLEYSERTFIITRLGPIVGPGDRQFLPSVVNALKHRFIPKLIDGGKDLVSLTSPWDVARAQVFLAANGSDISGEAFNIANHPIKYREIFASVARYYNRRPPKFSMKSWFFKLNLPLLKFLRKIFPNSSLLQMALSPTALAYLGKTYVYSIDKITQLGFQFEVTAEQTIEDYLVDADPNKTEIRLGKYYENKSS